MAIQVEKPKNMRANDFGDDPFDSAGTMAKKAAFDKREGHRAGFEKGLFNQADVADQGARLVADAQQDGLQDIQSRAAQSLAAAAGQGGFAVGGGGTSAGIRQAGLSAGNAQAGYRAESAGAIANANAQAAAARTDADRYSLEAGDQFSDANESLMNALASIGEMPKRLRKDALAALESGVISPVLQSQLDQFKK